MLKLGLNTVISEQNIVNQYVECFNGVGKLKDFQLTIPINKDIQQVAQPLRRIPYSLRDKLSKKLKELESLDIIEQVHEPTPWVSPAVVVPKENGDIRRSVNRYMRQANEAVVRECHTIPVLDEVLQDLNKSKVFSKLDIKWAYHQIELSPESREISYNIFDS